jgi:hypothetical protein
MSPIIGATLTNNYYYDFWSLIPININTNLIFHNDILTCEMVDDILFVVFKRKRKRNKNSYKKFEKVLNFSSINLDFQNVFTIIQFETCEHKQQTINKPSFNKFFNNNNPLCFISCIALLMLMLKHTLLSIQMEFNEVKCMPIT